MAAAAQNLIDEIIASGGDPGGVRSNALVGHIHRGYPSENLLTLLRSANPKVIEAGAWLASEIGEHGSGLYFEMVELLHHQAWRVRFLAVNYVLLNARSQEVDVIRSVVSCLKDDSADVRWKTLDFFRRLDLSRVRGAIVSFEGNGLVAEERLGLELLVASGEEANERARRYLRSQNQLLVSFGAIFAARQVDSDGTLLESAAQSVDPAVAEFAAKALRRLEKKRR